MEALSLIDGGPPALAMLALQERLLEVFPRAKFNHQVVPPRMTPVLWTQMTQKTPFVGLGWESWRFRPNARLRGELTFNLFLVTKNRPGWLLTGDKTAAGVFGMTCLAAAALHHFSVAPSGGRPLGTAIVEQVGGLFSEDWVADDLGTAGLVVKIPEVELFDPALQAELPDFLQLGTQWNFGEAVAEDVIDVRSEA